MKRTVSMFLALVLQISLFGVYVIAEENNLARGKSVTVETGVPVTKSYGNYSDEFDKDESKLTDGIVGSGEEIDEGYFVSFRGYSRIVTVDLGDTKDVASVEAGFFHSKNSAFYMPRVFTVSLSEDGEGYQTVATVEAPYSLSDERSFRVPYVAKFARSYKARYVRVEYTVDIFAACDEICVYEGANGAETVPDGEVAVTEAPTSLDGACNIIKMYNGYYPEQDIGDDTYEEILPYIAYLDKSGNIADVMFDGLAFVPCHTDYPSGGRLTKTGGKPGAIKSDWDEYVSNTFKEGVNLDALDDVVGDVYKALGIEGTYPVFLTMPYPTVIDGAFGDINGDGVPEFCYTYEERLAILKYYTDEYVRLFNEAGYENIRLSGFYWYREEVNFSDSDHEDKLVKAFNQYAHKLGFKTIFDPFFLSTGFDMWRELGFDACVMQPNYAEIKSDRAYYKEGMLEEFASILPSFSLGVELETVSQGGYAGSDYIDYAKNYLQYLRTGVKYGYDSVIKTFYQGGGPGTLYDFCHADISQSRGAILRYLYDQTYLFISGKMTLEAPSISGNSEIEVQSGKRARESLEVTDADSTNYELSLVLKTEPQHGSIAFTSYNGYSYKPDDGFTGSDSFVIAATDGYGESEELSVTVTVTEAVGGDASSEDTDQAQSEEPQENTSSAHTDDQQKGISPIPFIIAGAAVVAAAVFFIFKKKK